MLEWSVALVVACIVILCGAIASDRIWAVISDYFSVRKEIRNERLRRFKPPIPPSFNFSYRDENKEEKKY